MDCDTLLMVGTSFPYSEFLPKEGQARGVQIDIDGRMLAIRYPTEVNLLATVMKPCKPCFRCLERKADRSWRETIEKGVAEWWKVLEGRAMSEHRPINPQRAFWELSPRLPENCILSSDSGSAANWYARDLKIRRGMMASLSGSLATMGPGVPYSIAAKFAFPDRVAIALVGDGAMLMNGNNGLITIAKYWHEWSDPRLIVLVLHNNDLNQVTWELRVMMGDPKFSASQDVPDFSYARYAELLGLRGMRIDQPDQLGPGWDEAFASDRPCVVEVITDPDVPPLPPHITLTQASKFAATLYKGDPNEGGIIRESLRELVQGVFPHKRSKE